MADTRKDKRAPVSLKVRFKSATVDEFIVQYAADISRGGVFIKSKSPMPVGTLLKFEIQLKDESPLIHGVGRVVWKRDAGDAAGAEPSGMGIKFIRMDPECRAMVDRIVDQRGDAPGQFEAGGGDSAEEPAAPESVAPTREVKPRKATMPFFPAGPTEAELPRPEDRTQVRHASEFLASALAEAGADEAAREAERRAEETRKRQEELERQRIAAAERDAQAIQDAERAEAKAKADAEAKAKADADAAKAAAAAATATSIDEPVAAAAGAADTVPAVTAKSDAAETRPVEKKAEAKPVEKKAEPKPAEKKGEPKPAEKRPSKAPPAVVAAPQPAEEPKSYGVPIAIGLAAVLGLSAIVWSQTGGREEEPDTTTAAAPVEETAPEEAPPVAPPEEEVVAGAEEAIPTEGTEEGTPPVEGTPTGTGTEAAAAGTEEAPAAPMARFRVETTPPGATISVGGRAAGTSPAEVEAPVGAATTITARLAGHREGTQEITPTATQRPVRLTLQAMPYVLEVTTTPPGVRVRVGGRTATTAAGTPSRMTLPRPGSPVTVTGTRSGYVDATETVAPGAFTERDGEMVATVSLTLAERPTPPPTTTPTTTTRRPPREPAAEPAGEAGGEPAGETPEAAPPPREPTPEPEAPPPAPREEPTEAPPDNPF